MRNDTMITEGRAFMFNQTHAIYSLTGCKEGQFYSLPLRQAVASMY